MEKKIKDKQKGISSVLFGICSVVVIVIFAILGYFYYTTQQELKDLKGKVDNCIGGEIVVEDENSSSSDSTVNSDNINSNTSTSKCGSIDGEYYGELIEGNIYMKQHYKFNKDGTYTTWVESSEGNAGYYIVAGESIYFLQKPSYGIDNSLSAYFYSISEDCKIITAYLGESKYTLTKVE